MPDTPPAMLEELARHWRGLLITGLVFVLLGTFGIGAVGLFTLIGVFWVGGLLLLGGVIQILQAFRTATLSRSLPFLILGLLYALLGGYVMANPVVSAGALTLIIAVAIAITSVFRLFIAWHARGGANVFLLIVSAVIGLALSGMIFAQWPQSGEWVVGLFLAIELLMNGWMLVMVALAARRYH
ncbi:hypothetical protein A11A3_08030 [Alcanivorax hongdengensis A-11-3]|uniref:Acid-resistance membrane protein n=1 Tax=Alcanivorax hongdengensis A-11-3 TaxID=1177179 RepID=L0WC46_9GAMM|nr:DUF308 domain-containing protein [Alcanivorax hongdengensis]EKF74559.1 hypothetical protein A11A3_08030 [Alcanivorax hongdengensis A-11-3]